MLRGRVGVGSGKPTWSCSTFIDSSFSATPPFTLGQRVTVTYSVSDLAMPPNTNEFEYSFVVSSGNGTGGDIDRSGRVDGNDLNLE